MPADKALAPTSAVILETLSAHEASFRRFVRSRVPANDVDDVLQLAAVRAIERAETLSEPDRVMAWLYRIHRNVITDTLRKRASRQRMMDSVASEPCSSSASEAIDACDCSVVQASRLAPAYAEVLSLVDAGNASVSQAAKTLGISASNVSVRLHRARTCTSVSS